MKHSSSREVYKYWNERRGLRPQPERADIDPAPIRRVLGDTFILAFDRAAGHPFRLAGTRVCALFGRELKGDPFVPVWEGEHRAQLRELVETVADETVGIVARATGLSSRDHSADLELLLLPLSHRGDSHARVLGVLAPLAMPPWLGLHWMDRLALGMHRTLAPALNELEGPSLMALPQSGRIRRGLVVYDGGRAE